MEELLKNESQIVNIILIAIGLLLFMSVAIILFFYFSRKKIIKTELEKATLEISYQKEVIQSTLITQEEERKRIAQDLHDAISAKLNVVSLNANFLVDGAITVEEANKVGASILKITTTVLESSRKIAHNLLPPTLQKFGLDAALEELCEELYETKQFQLKYHLEYAEGFLQPDAELHLFRIVQELMSNSIKYSEANEIELKLETNKNNLSLQYHDDGKGFDIKKAKNAKGLGMSGIENRVQILNGKLYLESSKGQGVTVKITIANAEV